MEINKEPANEKKDWIPPKLLNLAFKETLGGSSIADGENEYADPDPDESIG